MLTGKWPFQGDNEAAVIYSIVNEEPQPVTALRTGVPMVLDGIIAKALAKDPALRYQHMDELRVDLKALGVTYTRTSRISIAKRTLRTPKKAVSWFPWIIAALVTVIATWWWLEIRRPADLVVNRSHILLPESAPIAPIGSAPSAAGRPALAISPDGSLLVYVADAGAETQLYLRPLDQFEAIPLPGTESAYHPFFSADAEWIGFFTGNLLKKIAVSGGEPVTLCTVFDPFGASWGDNDRIVFSSHWGSKLWSVSSSGGVPDLLSEKTSRTYRYLWPEILPGGKAALISE